MPTHCIRAAVAATKEEATTAAPVLPSDPKIKKNSLGKEAKEEKNGEEDAKLPAITATAGDQFDAQNTYFQVMTVADNLSTS